MHDDDSLRLVVKEFKRLGILLESDQKLPSVAGLIAGGPTKGSWWGHPKGKLIWRTLKRFTTREDVLTTRLVSRKVTFLHRTLWPEFIAIGTSKEWWQTEALSSGARSLLKLTEKDGEVRTDEIPPGRHGSRTTGDSALELERRLLVYGEDVHTPNGFHGKILRPWRGWVGFGGLDPNMPSVTEAKSKFEALVQGLNEETGGDARLPWKVAQ